MLENLLDQIVSQQDAAGGSWAGKSQDFSLLKLALQVLRPTVLTEGVAAELVGQEWGSFVRRKATDVTLLVNAIIQTPDLHSFHSVRVNERRHLEHALGIGEVALQEHLPVPLR